MTIIAIVKTLQAGYDLQKKRMEDLGFKVGDRIEVRDILVHSSSTDIYLEGYEGSFNSVFFEFEENDKEFEPLADRRFNSYLSMYDDCD